MSGSTIGPTVPPTAHCCKGWALAVVSILDREVGLAGATGAAFYRHWCTIAAGQYTLRPGRHTTTMRLAHTYLPRVRDRQVAAPLL